MIQVETLPAFSDNYIWLLHNSSSQAWVVDPGDAEPVLGFLKQQQLNLAGILLTHHHGDHDGGVAELQKYYPQLRVISGQNTQSPFPTETFPAGSIGLILDIEFELIDVPGHTLDHVAFYAASEQLLFVGDTLFSGGCGRLFEGTAEQMYDSLNRLSTLPSNTRVYCAHEYTLANLTFALTVEPNNAALIKRYEQVQTLRSNQQPTVPSTLALEKATNPFLRSHETSVKLAAQRYQSQQTGEPAASLLQSESAVFALIRHWKDDF